jgi:hypothetical protein
MGLRRIRANFIWDCFRENKHQCRISSLSATAGQYKSRATVGLRPASLPCEWSETREHSNMSSTAFIHNKRPPHPHPHLIIWRILSGCRPEVAQGRILYQVLVSYTKLGLCCTYVSISPFVKTKFHTQNLCFDDCTLHLCFNTTINRA